MSILGVGFQYKCTKLRKIVKKCSKLSLETIVSKLEPFWSRFGKNSHHFGNKNFDRIRKFFSIRMGLTLAKVLGINQVIQYSVRKCGLKALKGLMVFNLPCRHACSHLPLLRFVLGFGFEFFPLITWPCPRRWKTLPPPGPPLRWCACPGPTSRAEGSSRWEQNRWARGRSGRPRCRPEANEGR